MGDEITATRTCGECNGVSRQCQTCRRWYCSHLVKRAGFHVFCVDCYPEVAT